MKKMIAIMIAITIILGGAFYYFYIRDNNIPNIEEIIDYEEQFDGGKLAQDNKDNSDNPEDIFLIETEVGGITSEEDDLVDYGDQDDQGVDHANQDNETILKNRR